jgi:hypothetical protein
VLSAIRTATLYQPSRLRYAVARLAGKVMPLGTLAAKNTGMALCIEGGGKLFVFSDRKLLERLNGLYREATAINRSRGPKVARPAH